MKYRRIDNRITVRLERGELFFEQIYSLLASENITGGWMYGIGGANWVELGLYRLDDKQYHWKKFDGPLEISNLSGVIAMSDQEGLHVHAHATIAGADMNASAGHVKEIEVAGTLELVIDIDQPLKRRHDEDIGLALLEFD